MTDPRPRPVADVPEAPATRALRPVVHGRPHLALRLLGGFRLTADGRFVELPAGAQRLVAVLALRGRVSRSRLAGTLWADASEHRALGSLRTGIWRVNQAAPGLIESTAGTVDVGRGVDVDVHRLVAAALDEMGDDAGRSSVAGPSVEGELLPEWQDDWLLADRERLRQLRLHLLEAAAERLTREGRYGLALDAALEALRADALRESAHRAVIRVHLAEGNAAEAARAYNVCRDVLHRDVGIEPSPATRQLVEESGVRWLATAERASATAVSRP